MTYSIKNIDNALSMAMRTNNFTGVLNMALKANQMLLWEGALPKVLSQIKGIKPKHEILGLLKLINSYNKKEDAGKLLKGADALEDEIFGTGLAHVVLLDYSALLYRNLGKESGNKTYITSALEALASADRLCEDIPQMHADIWRGYISLNRAGIKKDIGIFATSTEIRMTNALLYQHLFLDGKSHLYAEAGYAAARLGNTIVDGLNDKTLTKNTIVNFGNSARQTIKTHKVKDLLEMASVYAQKCIDNAYSHPLSQYTKNFRDTLHNDKHI
jgi:hypothetical protein